MIDYQNIVKVVIADVVEAIDEPVKSHNKLGCFERRLVIQTREGKTFDLVLQAATAEELEFYKRPETDWLEPKVYKGKSMHEMEMDEDK